MILLGLFKGQKLDNKYELLVRITPGKEYVKGGLYIYFSVCHILCGEKRSEFYKRGGKGGGGGGEKYRKTKGGKFLLQKGRKFTFIIFIFK